MVVTSKKNLCHGGSRRAKKLCDLCELCGENLRHHIYERVYLGIDNLHFQIQQRRIDDRFADV